MPGGLSTDFRTWAERFLLFPTFPTSLLYRDKLKKRWERFSFVSHISYESFISWEIEETVRKISFVSYLSYELYLIVGNWRNGEKDFPIFPTFPTSLLYYRGKLKKRWERFPLFPTFPTSLFVIVGNWKKWWERTPNLRSAAGTLTFCFNVNYRELGVNFIVNFIYSITLSLYDVYICINNLRINLRLIYA